MLLWNGLAPIDLMRGWDSSRDGTFNFKEFLRMMKKLVRPGEAYQDLWDDEIRPVVQLTFRAVSGKDRTLDVTEFEKYLNKGWVDAKARMLKQKAGHQAADDIFSPAFALSKARSWRRKSSESSLAASDAAEQVAAERRREAPQLPKTEQVPKSKAGVPLDRSPGWEVRAYLTRVAMMAELPRPAGERWRLLAEAQQQLRERQNPPPEEVWWAV